MFQVSIVLSLKLAQCLGVSLWNCCLFINPLLDIPPLKPPIINYSSCIIKLSLLHFFYITIQMALLFAVVHIFCIQHIYILDILYCSMFLFYCSPTYSYASIFVVFSSIISHTFFNLPTKTWIKLFFSKARAYFLWLCKCNMEITSGFT